MGKKTLTKQEGRAEANGVKEEQEEKKESRRSSDIKRLSEQISRQKLIREESEGLGLFSSLGWLNFVIFSAVCIFYLLMHSKDDPITKFIVSVKEKKLVSLACLGGVYAIFYPVTATIVLFARIFHEGFDNSRPREQFERLTGWGKRAAAAHQNTLEALVGFTVAYLISYIGTAPSSIVAKLSVIFLGTRIIYPFLYIFNLPTMRTIVWLVGWTCLVCMCVLPFDIKIDFTATPAEIFALVKEAWAEIFTSVQQLAGKVGK